MPKIDVSGWREFYDRNTYDLNPYDHYDEGFRDAMDLADDWFDARAKESVANRDWLDSLSPAELVEWIKNTAVGMSDAELLRWMGEKHEKFWFFQKVEAFGTF